MTTQLEITDESGQSSRLNLTGESYVIGRSSEADIQLERSTVSRQHAKLTYENGAWLIADLGSRSGVKVNGRRVQQCAIGRHDEIQISRFSLRLTDDSNQDMHHTTAWLSEADAPDISTLMVGSAPKVGYEQIGLLNTFGQKLMDDPVQSSRMRQLCKLLVEKVVGAQWTLVIETQAEVLDRPRVLAGWPDRVLGLLDTLHLSKTAIAATIKDGSPVLASNDRNRDGVELSIIADAPAAVAVCPLGKVDGWDRLLYVSLPPACATTDWLAVISLAAKEYQQAEALLREREQARNRAALEQDLENARAIQHSILPDGSLQLGLDIAWSFVPCDAVGGDLIDIVELPDGKVMIAIADVSGHGLSAALATLSIHSVLRTCIKSGLDAEATMTMLNEHLCAYLPPGRFVTMIAVMIDPKTGQTQSINAGHHPPLVVNHAGEVRELDTGHHLILGVEAGPMPAVSDQLAADETMLLYTDGLLELTLDDGSMLNLKGLSELFCQACSTQENIERLTKRIRKRIDDCQGDRPAMDDQSFLLLRLTDGSVGRD
jgi:serine phosphatase RsbU (regulator of sigma subunit)